MEHRAVRGVHFVGAVDAAGAHDAERRLARLHRAGLHGRGVGAQHHVILDIERILRVAGGMVFRQVQQLEVERIQLHLRAFRHVEAHAGEHVDHFVLHLVQRMHRARFGEGTRLGHVDGFARELHFALGGAQRAAALVDHRADALAGGVDERAHLRALFGAELAHAAQKLRQAALFALKLHAQRLQRGGVVGLFQRFARFGHDLANLILHDSPPPV